MDLNDLDVAALEMPPGVDIRGKSVIVSRITADHISNNSSEYRGLCVHVFSPDTSPGSAVLDDHGRIIRVRQLTYHCTLE